MLIACRMKKKCPISFTLSVEHSLFLFVLIALLGLYGFTFSLKLVSPPSEYISREILLDRLEYGFSKINNTHIQVLSDPAGRGAWVVGIDGRKTRLFLVNIRGEILKDFILDLDLSQASDLEAHMMQEGYISLYYKHRSLQGVKIDLEGKILAGNILAEQTTGFSSLEDYLVFSNSEGLWGIPDIEENVHPEPILLAAEESESFSLCSDGEGQCLLYSVKDGDSVSPLIYAGSRDNFNTFKTIPVLPGGERKYFSRVVDTYVDDNILYALCLYRDGRFKINYISFLRIDRNSGEILQNTRMPFAYLKSRYEITEAGEGQVRFIHQISDRNGINLGLTTVSEEGAVHTDPYTKTRSMSKLGGFFKSGEYAGVIFSDIDYDKRTLLFASGDPDLINSTTSLRSIGFWYPFGTTLLLYLVSLIVGALQLLVIIPVPVSLSLLMDRLMSRGRNKNQVFPVIGLFVLQASLKLLVSYNLIHVYGLFYFHPPFIGEEPLIYFAILLSTCFSLWLTVRAYQNHHFDHSSYLDFYIRFAAYDYLQYTALILIYIASAVLSGKI